MPDKKEYAPIRKYILPAGNLGGEIRIFIPVTASRDDVIQMARMMSVVAEDWKEFDAE